MVECDWADEHVCHPALVFLFYVKVFCSRAVSPWFSWLHEVSQGQDDHHCAMMIFLKGVFEGAENVRALSDGRTRCRYDARSRCDV